MTTSQSATRVRSTFAKRLDGYADLLVRVGVNLQPGQGLMIRAQTEAAPLVRLVAEKAYRLGCPLVEVMWGDDDLQRARFLHAPGDSFDRIAQWRADGMLAMAQQGFAALRITGEDPDLLADAEPTRWATYARQWQEATRAYAAIAMSDGIAWCVAGYAGQAWATRVFPKLSPEEAVSRLWDAIFTATRSTDPDPIAAWQAHDQRLHAWCDRLNERRYAALHYRGPGTALRLGLAHGHRWDGGSTRTPNGVKFVPNMPTEEVFTAPHREQADGTVRASMPLVEAGTLIEGIELRFAGGRVVEASATRGEDVLRRVLATDEGASRLGEAALVPVSSPIKQAGILFYEMLFDENAACHLALGRAYPTTVIGGTDMSPDEALAAGLNDSLTHVDFMIGSSELDVDGETATGELQPLMRAGEWVD